MSRIKDYKYAYRDYSDFLYKTLYKADYGDSVIITVIIF